MADDAIVFAMANPTPEIMPDEAKKGGAKVVATGRSDFPNQINNVLVFPGVFRGAFDVRASDINEEMKIAASKAIAALISDEELSADNIIPKAFDKRVGPAVTKAVAEIPQVPEGRERAVYCKDTVTKIMEELRKPVDELEMLVDKEMWPMPSYGDLIFEV